ncbi:MAG: cobalamin biosynthesis protein CobQ [Proteobacteria bacterium]|nr:cobalamin biosynthesis protein CobQ [Pseudomonadota bacterium]
MKKPIPKYSLTIGWLYPDLMGTYGDRGNISVLQKRCLWRNINPIILPITKATNSLKLESVDLLFGGGAQDREQKLVEKNLRKQKGNLIRALIEKDVPSLFVCGSAQLLGMYYQPTEGKCIEGLGIFKIKTVHAAANEKRCIGNTVVEVLYPQELKGKQLVGFENHGGRTYLLDGGLPFAQVISGNGNNGQDNLEGVVYHKAIGTYLHGPLLPKNPLIADYLIKAALELKYQKPFSLQPLDDQLSDLAQQTISKRLSKHPR